MNEKVKCDMLQINHKILCKTAKKYLITTKCAIIRYIIITIGKRGVCRWKSKNVLDNYGMS